MIRLLFIVIAINVAINYVIFLYCKDILVLFPTKFLYKPK